LAYSFRVGRDSLRVLYVIDSLVGGGAEKSLLALAPLYRERGVELHVAYLKERPGLKPEFEATGTRLISLDGSGGRIGSMRRIRSLLSELSPDLLHTTLFEADIAGRVAAALERLPVVTSLVNTTYGPEHLGDPRLKWWKVRATQVADIGTGRLAIRFHAITEHVRSTMAARLKIDPDRIDVVPRGRDPRLLGARTPERSERVRAALGLGADTPIVLAAARQEYQKGLDVLLRSWPEVTDRVPGSTLIVAGRDGGLTRTLRDEAQRLNLGGSVRWLGHREDVPDLLASADVFVLPSRWEGFGSVLVEAMAVEIPIVASDLPAIREVVEHGRSALLVAPESSASLASALVTSLTNRSEAGRRAGAARDRFEAHYTIDRVADGMVSFYERALSKTSSSPSPKTAQRGA